MISIKERLCWITRHDIDISTNDMIYVSGVVSSLDSLIKNLTNEKDGVLLLSPIYSGFYSVIKNNNVYVIGICYFPFLVTISLNISQIPSINYSIVIEI